MLLATAQPLLLGLGRTAAQQGMRQSLIMAPLAVLNWLSDSATNLALLTLPHSNSCRCDGRSGRSVASMPPGPEAPVDAAAIAAATAATTAAATTAAARRYTLSGVLLGPVIFVAASVAVHLGWMPYFVSYVGNSRIVTLSFVQRSLILPTVQRLPLRHVLAASPLLAMGEALQLAALQPTWGWRRVTAYVAARRLVAAAVAAAWEVLARRRFAALMGRRRQGEAGRNGGGGGGGGRVKKV